MKIIVVGQIVDLSDEKKKECRANHKRKCYKKKGWDEWQKFAMKIMGIG